MTELHPLLDRLGLLLYHDRFVGEGFETWEQLCDITEADLEALNVSLGHRRRLQREMAQAGRSPIQRTPKGGSLCTPGDDISLELSNMSRADDSEHERKKRKYKRRPKADMNAPKKPLSAYVLYANHLRESLRQENLSFADGAKVTGDQWQVLDPLDKEWWRSQAAAAKEKYDAHMSVYRRTSEYRDHKAYVDVFKSEHAEQVARTEQRLPRDQSYDEKVNGMQSDFDTSRASAFMPKSISEKPSIESIEQSSLVNGIWALANNPAGGWPPLTRDFLQRKVYEASRADKFHHTQAINPFNIAIATEVKDHLASFQNRIDNIFFLYDTRELESLVQQVSNTFLNTPNQIMCELCLIIALGVQISDHGSMDQVIMWYENGRRYLDDENWGNELWAMRALVLISLYHIGDRMDTSRYYLNIAISIGEANGLGHIEAAEHRYDLESIRLRTNYLKLWQTAMFLKKWLNVHATIPTSKTMHPNYILHEAIQSPPYDASGGFEISTIMDRLIHIMHDVSIYRDTAPLKYYRDHLRELDTLKKHFPPDPRLPTVKHESNQAPIAAFLNVPEEQNIALLYLHTMHMGTAIALTWPLLLQVATASIIKEQEMPSELAEREQLAYTCLSTSSNLAHFCAIVLRAGGFPRHCWLPTSFLFDAALVTVLGIIWCRRRTPYSSSDVSNMQWLKRLEGALDVSIEVLGFCGASSKTASWNWTLLTQLKQWLEITAPQDLEPSDQGNCVDHPSAGPRHFRTPPQPLVHFPSNLRT